MDCTGVASLVVAYHLGAVDDDERSAVEEHLVACTTCLKTYLALKRATEKGNGDRPSSKARERLRAAVEREVGRRARPRQSPVAILARRIPLYQGLVAAAIAAAITLATPTIMRRLVHHDVGNGAPEVDTSRPTAASLQIY